MGGGLFFRLEGGEGASILSGGCSMGGIDFDGGVEKNCWMGGRPPMAPAPLWEILKPFIKKGLLLILNLAESFTSES